MGSYRSETTDYRCWNEQDSLVRIADSAESDNPLHSYQLLALAEDTSYDSRPKLEEGCSEGSNLARMCLSPAAMSEYTVELRHRIVY